MLKRIMIAPVILVILALAGAAHAASPAGIRWEVEQSDGIGSHWERIGIKGTLADQEFVTFKGVFDPDPNDISKGAATEFELDVKVMDDHRVLIQQIMPASFYDTPDIPREERVHCYFRGYIWQDASSRIQEDFPVKQTRVTGVKNCYGQYGQAYWQGVIQW